MEKQLARTSFSRSTLDLIQRLRGYVQGAWAATYDPRTGEHDEERFRDSLKGIIDKEYGGIERMSGKIRRDVIAHDVILEKFGNDLVTKLVKGPVERRYEVLTRCDRCSGTDNGLPDENNNGKRKKPRQKKRRRNIGVTSQQIPVDRYIREVEFNEGTILPVLTDEVLGNQRLKMHCPECQGTLTATASRNIIIPADDIILYLIALRVKSAGEYCAKLVDNIFYDDSDPQMRKRDVVDRLGFLLAVNYPNSTHEKVLRREFHKRFGKVLRTDARRHVDLGDAMSYAVLDVLCAEFGNSHDYVELQDNISCPVVKMMNGRQETFKQLQFKFGIQGRLFEGKIYTKATHEKENDRKSVVSYSSYRQVEEQLRQSMFLQRPQMRILYEVLLPLFPQKQNLMLRG